MVSHKEVFVAVLFTKLTANAKPPAWGAPRAATRGSLRIRAALAASKHNIFTEN